MNANTIELILKILETAGPLIVQIPSLGAKWIANRNEVVKMIEEGRNPTPDEHRRLARELDSLMGSLEDALASAEAAEAPTERNRRRRNFQGIVDDATETDGTEE